MCRIVTYSYLFPVKYTEEERHLEEQHIKIASVATWSLLSMIVEPSQMLEYTLHPPWPLTMLVWANESCNIWRTVPPLEIAESRVISQYIISHIQLHSHISAPNLPS